MEKTGLNVRKVDGATLKVIFALLRVLLGWVAASYSFMYFTVNGVASNYATGYSSIVWFAVFGAFLLVAFKIKREHYQDVFIVRRERRYIGFLF